MIRKEAQAVFSFFYFLLENKCSGFPSGTSHSSQRQLGNVLASHTYVCIQDIRCVDMFLAFRCFLTLKNYFSEFPKLQTNMYMLLPSLPLHLVHPHAWSH